jgi:hypothetical protein
VTNPARCAPAVVSWHASKPCPQSGGQVLRMRQALVLSRMPCEGQLRCRGRKARVVHLLPVCTLTCETAAAHLRRFALSAAANLRHLVFSECTVIGVDVAQTQASETKQTATDPIIHVITPRVWYASNPQGLWLGRCHMSVAVTSTYHHRMAPHSAFVLRITMQLAVQHCRCPKAGLG